jgi:hypothetical protein
MIVHGAELEKNIGEKKMTVNIFNIAPAGTEIPFEHHTGNVGHWIEDLAELAGLQVNRGKGIDLPGLSKEIKTKSLESKSPNSIATMTIWDLINTPYPESAIFEKMQNHYTVEHSNVYRIVVNETNIDFSNPAIQKLLEEAYELGRQEIAENFKDGIVLPYVRKTEYGQFEKVPNRDSYRFRIPVDSMKKLKGMAKSQFNSLFDVVDI